MFDTIIPTEQITKIESHLDTVRREAEELQITDETSLGEAQQQVADIVISKKSVKAFGERFLKPVKDALKEMKKNVEPVTIAYKAYDEIDKIIRGKMNVYIKKVQEEEKKAADASRKLREAEAARNKARMNQLLELGFVWLAKEEVFGFQDLVVTTVEIKTDEDEKWDKNLEGLAQMVEKLKSEMKEEEVAAEAEKESAPPPVLEDDPEPAQKTDHSAKVAGATVYTTTRWTFKEVDLSQVPLEYHILDTKKINAMIKAGTREIPGLEIFEEEKTAVRTS